MASLTDPTLEGTWQMVRAELNGEPAHELITSNTTLELAAGNYVVSYAGKIADRGTFRLSENLQTKMIILSGASGPNAGGTIPSIYQIAGDRLRICYGLDGIPPDVFSSEKGESRYLATYRRI